uniref:Endoplasmic reticulum-Golgi intermediate compartment protein n=1 Tax=Felis catus TaxID=9685 RepID=A0ABI7Z0R0_FELCA
MPFDFRRFDIYRKVPKDLTQPTYTGAIISICCCLFILFLFLSELTGFITTEVVNELYVDDPDKDSGGKIDVSLNISLPNLHCELVGLDIQDEMGRHEVGHIDNSMKIPLNNGAGCRFEGQFSINKPGTDKHQGGRQSFLLRFWVRVPGSQRHGAPTGWFRKGLLFLPPGKGAAVKKTMGFAVLSPECASRLYPLLAKQRPLSHSTHHSLFLHL